MPREEPNLAPSSGDRAGDGAGGLLATWVGHSTFLLQWGGLNVLTDPHFSKRASPMPWAGPLRFSPPGLSVEKLPEIHAVVLSHDHYDHLDRPSVDALYRRFGDGVTWITPLGYRDWFAGRGVTQVTELDWWEERQAIPGLTVTCLPAQHWTRRGRRMNQRLWASFGLRFAGQGGDADGGSASRTHQVYFGGDSGYFTGYRELGERCGPFDTLLLPIGAYEPRWFMQYSHMNPEDALEAYRDLGGSGHFVAMHWGTFRLTFEDPLEPPVRMEAAWREAGLDPTLLHLPRIGGTVRVGDGEG